MGRGFFRIKVDTSLFPSQTRKMKNAFFYPKCVWTVTVKLMVNSGECFIAVG